MSTAHLSLPPWSQTEERGTAWVGYKLGEKLAELLKWCNSLKSKQCGVFLRCHGTIIFHIFINHLLDRREHTLSQAPGDIS